MYKYRGSATLTPPLLEGLHTLAPPPPSTPDAFGQKELKTTAWFL